MKKFSKWMVLAVITLVSFGLTSCSKDSDNNDVTTSKTKMSELKVPAGFNWNTSRNVNLNLVYNIENASGLLSKISVYAGDPSVDGKLLVNGSIGYGFPMKSTVAVPTSLSSLYIKIEKAEGGSEVISANISGNSLNYTFSATTKQTKDALAIETGPDCNTGCDVEISGNSNVTIKGGKTYCIKTTFTGSINFDAWQGGGTLRICGTANISNINGVNNNCNIIVSDGGVFNTNNLVIEGSSTFKAFENSQVTIGNFNMNQTLAKLYIYTNSFTINSTFSTNAKIYNYGTFAINGNFNINSNAVVENYGDINVSGSFEANQNFTNEGKIYSQSHMNFNSNAVIVNKCLIKADGNVNFNNTNFTNIHGTVISGDEMHVNGGAQLILQNQSEIMANGLDVNADITGSGSLNSIVVNGTSRINGQKKIKGAIEFADNDGVLANGSSSNFTNGATFVTIANATNYIPQSACNPVGIGTPSIVDTDGDGVADDLDDYPTDPARAYDNYFPSKTGFASLAFEDLWPGTGDYDFNDLVVNVRFNRVTNASNQVVEVKNKYYVAAIGGSLTNGFGVQFDNLSPSDIQSVTGTEVEGGNYSISGNGTENGPIKAVVILWNDPRNIVTSHGGSMFNTIEGNPTGESDTLNLVVKFTTPKAPELVGTAPFNHFLIKNNLRGAEIHLFNALPTSMADMTLFATANDASSPADGLYYRTKDNLPWGLFIPEIFAYPAEKDDILTAHLKFGAWAESAGATNTDWYKNISGYRNNDNIYGAN